MSPRRIALLRTLLFALCAAGTVAPALAAGGLFADRYDWSYFDSMGEISRRSVLWYHQAPLWNPYSCGGEVALANPQSLDASPTFLLVLLFGTALGYKLALCLYYLCAMDGAFRLARRFGASDGGSTLAGLGYGLSGYLALHFSEGHLTFVGVTLYPYLLVAYDRALDEIEWIVPAGAVAAWIALMGGTFTPPMAGELLALWAILAALKRRSARPFAILLLSGAVALLIGAARMFPVLQFVKDHPRPPFMRAIDASMPWFILGDLTAWRKFGPMASRKYWAHEYSARLPYLLAPLWAAMIFYVAWSRRRLAALSDDGRSAVRRLALLVVATTLLTMGNFSSLAPWSLLQRLPVIRDLRVPSRHLVLITLGLTPLAAIGWDLLGRYRLARGTSVARFRRLTLIAIAITSIDGTIYGALQYRKIFTMAPNRIEVPAPFFHVEGDWRSMRNHLFAGHGSLGCDEEAPLQRAEELDPGDVPQERLLDPSAGDVVASEWSPNRRVVTVELRHATILLVNSNWNEHWRVDRGALTRVAGRLAVDLSSLPPGHHVITLRYAPRSYTIGVAVSGAAIPLFFGWFLWRRRRRRDESVNVVARLGLAAQ